MKLNYLKYRILIYYQNQYFVNLLNSLDFFSTHSQIYLSYHYYQEFLVV